MTQITLALCQYQPDLIDSWNFFTKKIEHLIQQANEQQANFFLLPEYAGLELTSLFQGSVQEKFTALQTILPKYLDYFQKLSQQYSIYIQSGTIVVEDPITKRFFNRAYLFAPSGTYGYQDKNFLTVYEKNCQLIQPGKSLSLFHTEYGIGAIAICYDSEFPLLVHQAIKNGAKFILVPSCTDHETGYYRVSISCQARAIENQCYIINTYLVGQFKGCEFIDTNMGRSAIYTPIDYDFPHDGVLIRAQTNEAELISATIDLNRLKQLEQQASVNNCQDMTNSEGILNNNFNRHVYLVQKNSL